jgi:hypothetical protein
MQELEKISAVAAPAQFKVPVGGLNRLEDYKRAVEQTLAHPERGKQFFAPDGHDH